MIKHLISGLALSLMLAGTALAQSPAAAPAPEARAPEARAPEARAPEAPAPEAPATAAATTPGSLDDCIAAASSLGQIAEAKTLAEDKLDKLDELFTKMEALCDARNFTEAAAIGRDIKTMLDGQ